jgi:hypothetical protein
VPKNPSSHASTCHEFWKEDLLVCLRQLKLYALARCKEKRDLDYSRIGVLGGFFLSFFFLSFFSKPLLWGYLGRRVTSYQLPALLILRVMSYRLPVLYSINISVDHVFVCVYSVCKCDCRINSRSLRYISSTKSHKSKSLAPGNLRVTV